MTAFQQRLLNAAVRAPSGDNCQPWRFRWIGAEAVAITPDVVRAKSFFDYEHRATAISIGAVIENMRMQAASEGYRTRVAYAEPGPGHDSSLVTFIPDRSVGVSPQRLAALYARTVNRRPFLPMPLSSALRTGFVQDTVDGVTVRMIADRHSIVRWAKVIELADRIRFSHPVIHEELFSKLVDRHTVHERRVGLEIERLGLGLLGRPLLRWLRPWDRVQRLSRWGLVRILAGQSGLLARSTGALVLITIANHSRESWIKAGEQMQRLWITAQEQHLQTHPMPVALYLDQRYQDDGLKNFLPAHERLLQQLRQALAELVPVGVGTMIFRLGWGWPMRGQSVRLPVENLLDQ